MANHLQLFKSTRSGPCFVCAKGPSSNELIASHDYTLGVTTFGVNDFERLFFPTTYTVIADRIRIDHDYGEELNKAVKSMTNSSSEFVFTSYPLRDKDGNGLAESKEVIYQSEDVYNYGIDELFQRNSIPKCNTSTINAIGLAMYMGFQQIGVIGFDLYNHPIARNVSMIDGGCKRLNDYAKQNGIEIINLSPRSMITAFEHLSLDQFYDLYIFEIF